MQQGLNHPDYDELKSRELQILEGNRQKNP
ncbi:MAG: hypothetical protein KatS3mg048_3715 [Caldilinea sp.]|nr:MAG: hypothetical protein KatS3mg048_3715 [Caldilinea sp.]